MTPKLETKCSALQDVTKRKDRADVTMRKV